MDDEYCKKLYDKYSRIFCNIPIIKCPEGWREVLEGLLDSVYTASMQFKKGSINIAAIKEKYGGMRIYVSYSLPADQIVELEQIVIKWEKLSYRVCMYCGTDRDVKITRNYMDHTICTKCKEEHDGIRK